MQCIHAADTDVTMRMASDAAAADKHKSAGC